MRYLENYYFTVALVMLIGSHGETFIEILYLTLTLLITVGVFAYLLSNISNIIEDIDREKS